MTARYRIVHFVPDPFVGSRVPVAALVEQHGTLSVAKVPSLPSPTCLGGRQAWSLVQVMLDDLAEATRFDRLPAGLGPQAHLDAVRRVPDGVVEAKKWVETMLAAHLGVASTEHHERIHRPRRATFGYQFFQTYKVDRFVSKTFRPGRDAGGFLAAAAALGPVSHFVEGAEDILLMEPIVPHKADWEEDVRGVAKTFGAYKMILERERGTRKAHLAAYVLEGGSVSTRSSILHGLAGFADQIVDTSNGSIRARFLEQIVATGRSKDDLFA